MPHTTDLTQYLTRVERLSGLGLSVCIDCETWWHRQVSKPETTWTVSVVGDTCQRFTASDLESAMRQAEHTLGLDDRSALPVVVTPETETAP